MKKNILKILIGSLIISAILGIFIIITGSFGNTQAKILSTTITIFLFSISGLCCSTIYENDKYKKISTAGMLINLIGAVYTLLIIWGLIDVCIIFCKSQTRFTWQILWSLIVLSCSSAHISLILSTKNENNIVVQSKKWTIIISIILDIMILMLNWNIAPDSDIYTRTVFAVIILVALGTIVTPILNKVYKDTSIDNSQQND